MPSAVNPLTKLHDALWALFEDDSDFATLIKPGNRIKLNQDENRNPLKQQVASADLPEFWIVATGYETNLLATSTSTKVVGKFQLVVNTGDYRLTEITDAVNWIVLCRLAQWRSTLTQLTWKNKTYVTNVRATSAAIAESDSRRNRSIKGFSTVWQCDVEMHIATADLTFAE